MKIFSFNCNKYFLYVVGYWILEIGFYILFLSNRDYFSLTKDFVPREYTFVILLNIGDLLSGFLVLYTKRVSKTKRDKEIEKKDDNINQHKNELIYDTTANIQRKHFKRKMIIIGILDYISRSFFWIAYAITGAEEKKVCFIFEKDIVCTVDIIMRYIFSIFILKISVFKHGIVSIVMICVGFIILLTSDCLYIKSSEEKGGLSMSLTLFYSGILLLRGISFPYEDTIVKQLFLNDYIFPGTMQFYRGLIESVIIIVITPLLCLLFGFKVNFNYQIPLVQIIFTLIFYTIVVFIKAFFLLKIIYHFSSQSVSILIISESLGGSIFEIIDIIRDGELSKSDIIFIIPEIIGIFIILFAALIYDEVIIINILNLNQNVKIGIIGRAENEALELNSLEEIPLNPIMTLDDSDMIEISEDN